MNATLLKFGYPDTTIIAYHYWLVLLRRPQITLGSLVIAARGDQTQLSEIPPDAFSELSTVIKAIEATLKKLWNYDKLNYLMLMMVDPHVHWHVIPRYQKPVQWLGNSFLDTSWPKPPDLSLSSFLPAEIEQELILKFQNCWCS